MARWLSILVLGLMVGAGSVLLADPGTSNERRVIAPVAATGPDAAPTAINGQHIHGVKAQDIAAESKPDKPLDAVTRAQLGAELAAARDEALKYPTVADAEAAGFQLAGGFAPGSGAHYVNLGGLGGTGAIDVTKVNSYIYEGTSPTSRIVGLMYYSMSDAPEGFAGPNDHWHRHSNVCVNFSGGKIEVPFPADADVTAKECRAAGGSLMPVTGYMVHAWVVPGWESPLGVFSHDNPNVRCADGTYKTDKVGFCQGT
jgi:hypothetical protein